MEVPSPKLVEEDKNGDGETKKEEQKCCNPTLFLNLPTWVLPYLSDVLKHDLAFSRTSTWDKKHLSPEEKIEILKTMDEKNTKNKNKKNNDDDKNSILQLNQSCKASIVLSENEMYSNPEGNFQEEKLLALQNETFQAIITDDSSVLHEPAVQRFLQQQYQTKNVSIVIMSIEGVYDISPICKMFHVDWRTTAYTKRTVTLTDIGKTILSDKVFPNNEYCKALFVAKISPNNNNNNNNNNDEELFVEYMDPRDYEDESDYEDGPPPPGPGSPVITHIDYDQNHVVAVRAISYFGFVNPLDVNYGAIMLRLCYATKYMNERNNVTENDIANLNTTTAAATTTTTKPVKTASSNNNYQSQDSATPQKTTTANATKSSSSTNNKNDNKTFEVGDIITKVILMILLVVLFVLYMVPDEDDISTKKRFATREF